MFNKIFFYTFLIGMLILCSMSLSHADGKTMTLPNGQELNVENLTDNEILDAIKIAKKSMPQQKTTVVEIVEGINPSDLNEWRQVITGTIKDVCNDLNIAVNDFVKTPVGFGVAALIVYKVAGKDMLETAFDVVFAIPLWFTITFINLCLLLYFFKPVTVYGKITETPDKKIIRELPERSTRYPFKSNDSRNTLGAFIMLSEILMTVICMIIIF